MIQGLLTCLFDFLKTERAITNLDYTFFHSNISPPFFSRVLAFELSHLLSVEICQTRIQFGKVFLLFYLMSDAYFCSSQSKKSRELFVLL